jgi:hypothetical protein
MTKEELADEQAARQQVNYAQAFPPLLKTKEKEWSKAKNKMESVLRSMQELADSPSLPSWKKSILENAIGEHRSLNALEARIMHMEPTVDTHVTRSSSGYGISVRINIPSMLIESDIINNKSDVLKDAINKALTKQHDEIMGKLALLKLTGAIKDQGWGPEDLEKAEAWTTYAYGKGPTPVCTCCGNSNLPCPVHGGGYIP